ncbi:MAG: NADH-quinone oxidoreductase subunit N [Thiohalocapsa sp.]|uniref:NADH-quinone oxidoreductase subunit N n=1 Tax=Thiohalocapsa sp. TaxID=2497641 RepID=UPI0025F016A2|nr:NADH-quinone oxidoreductase subunit N [Thiohalocapsa sp.]MCG6939692.1 NADH-quinone oxidoreductase subunit N [Thiohalocapsa sp.]
MTSGQLTALLPIIVLGAVPVVLILAIALHRGERVTLWLTLIGLALALAALVPAHAAAPTDVTLLLRIDGVALAFTALAVLAGAATVLLARAGSPPGGEPPEELYVLVSLAVLGASVLAASRHLASLFIGLELISVSLFPMIAYARARPEALEAGIKYLVLSSVTTGMLLFGMALLYAGIGSLALPAIGRALTQHAGADVWVLGGIALVLTGLGMKLSLVPLHWWTPDVYEGAPAAVTGFLASVAKAAVIVVLLRLMAASNVQDQAAVLLVLGALAVLSMLVGNLLALRQRRVVRILAYSSIAHMGYLLVAVLAALFGALSGSLPGHLAEGAPAAHIGVGALGVEAVAFYLAAYVVTTQGAFGALGLTGAGELSDLNGLSRRRPWLAAAFTLMLLSLAGIPLTAGFIGKVYLFTAGVDGALWVPVGVLVVASVIGLFYYLRVVFAMYTAPADEAAPAAVPPATHAGGTALAALTLVLIWLGVWPEPLIALIRSTVGGAL